MTKVMCGVTLYHVETESESRTERYRKTYFPKATIYQQVSADNRRSKNGPWAERETVIRIPYSERMEMALGDRIAFGSFSEEFPPSESLQICGFADNRRGSRRVRHWKVVCR